MGEKNLIILDGGKAAPPQAKEVVNNKGIEDVLDLKAGLAKKALEAIDQAGRGLKVVYDKLETNTTDGQTLVVMAVCQAYINDAMQALLEREFSGLLDHAQAG